MHLTTADEEQTFEVSQKGFYIEIADIEGNKCSFPANGGVKEFKIRSNVEWVPVCEDENVRLQKNDNILSVKLYGNNLFVEKDTKIMLVPTDPELEGLVQTELILTQELNYKRQKGADDSIDENGYLTLTKTTRYVTKNNHGAGTYIWTFENINLLETNNISILMEPWPGPNIKFWLGSDMYFTTGGTFVSETTGENFNDLYSKNYYDGLTVEKLNKAKELKITVLPAENNQEEISVYIDGILVGRKSGHPDFWYHLPSFGFPVYFGIEGEGSITIKSFDIIPYEK